MFTVPLRTIILAAVVLIYLLFKITALTREAKELKRIIHELEGCEDAVCRKGVLENHGKKS